MKKDVMGELKKAFRPEFLNRVDEIIVFHPLEEKHLREIVGIMLEQFAKRLEKNDIEVQVTDSVKDLIVKKGYDTVYGARPLRRSIQSMIEDRIAEEMLEGNVKNGDKVLLDAKQDEIAVTVTSSSR